MDKIRAESTTDMEYITVRVDSGFKDALVEASRAEHRPLSNFCRLLLEYAFGHYGRAGSIHTLLLAQENAMQGRSKHASERGVRYAEGT